VLFDGHAFTPQTTPSSGRTITVTNIVIEDAQPMTRLVLPDTEAGSGSMTNLLGSAKASSATSGVSPCLAM